MTFDSKQLGVLVRAAFRDFGRDKLGLVFSYLFPLMFVVIIPAVAAMLPIDLTAKLSLVPILNASLLCKELVTGTYHWNFIAIIFLSTCVYAGVALFLAVKMFQREDVLFRS